MTRQNNSRLSAGFGQCSNQVLRNPDLSLIDKGLYSYLCSYANSRTNELCVPVEKMAAENNVTASTIKRSLRRLENQGVIRRKSQGAGLSWITEIIK